MTRPQMPGFPDSPNPAPPGLFCVEIRTDRWERLVAWYREVLGLEVLVRITDDRYALLRAGETRLALLGRDDPGPATGRVRMTFEVDNLDAVASRLRAAGAPLVERPTDSEGLDRRETRDPDGNVVQLFRWPEAK